MYYYNYTFSLYNWWSTRDLILVNKERYLILGTASRLRCFQRLS